MLRRSTPPRPAAIAVLAAAAVVLAACGATPSVTPSPSSPASAPPAASASATPAPTPAPTVAPPPATSPSPTAEDPTHGTIAQVAALTDRLRQHPDDAGAYRDLGLALLQRARETADPSFYDRADQAFAEALKRAPEDPLALVGLGTLQLARHRFADALVTGKRVAKLDPTLPAARGVMVDAYVELGRYDDAVTALQRMVDLRTDLASLARVSYVRELHGDLPGALDAMTRAASSGALAPEGEAYVTTLVGDLLVQVGDPARAATAYERALTIFPGYAPAKAGQGRLAVGAGDLPGAIADFEAASAILPLPEYVIALGEAREASGDPAGAAKAYDLARLETDLFRRSGVVVDLELALFEADHGDHAQALKLARAAYAERRTIGTADAVAWALFRAGKVQDAKPYLAESLKLGTQKALFRYHAGMIAAALGETARARRELRLALRLDPGFSATGARQARDELTRLG